MKKRSSRTRDFGLLISRTLIVAAAVLAGAAASVNGALSTANLVSSADAQMVVANPYGNYGAQDGMIVSPGAGAWQKRDVVRFDLSSIPSGALVVSATLTLRENPYTVGATRTIGLHRVTADWQEGSVSWLTRSGTESWTAAGGDFISAPSATKTLSWPGYLKSDSWDVTADVVSFLNGTWQNYGWIIKDENEGAIADFSWGFYTKETGTASYRPELAVTYSTVPEGSASAGLFALVAASFALELAWRRWRGKGAA